MDTANKLDLIKPRRFDVKREAKDLHLIAGTVIAEPLEQGFGHTIGNSLRRVLMSSLSSPAVTAVRVKDISHQFSAVPGVREDMVDIILNLKRVTFAGVASSNQERLILKKSGAGPVLAEDILLPSGIKVINPGEFILHIDKGGSIDMEMILEVKRGYVPSSKNERSEVGWIALDSFHSPVRNVSYRVEQSKSSKFLEYDCLILEVVTNGSVEPRAAVEKAAAILKDQFSSFVTFEESEEQVESAENRLGFDPILLKQVEEVLSLSVRASNCLQCCNIKYLGDLVHKTKEELLSTPNFGRKSLDELIDQLKLVNLELGMVVKNWPPRNVDELSKMYLKEDI